MKKELEGGMLQSHDLKTQILNLMKKGIEKGIEAELRM